MPRSCIPCIGAASSCASETQLPIVAYRQPRQRSVLYPECRWLPLRLLAVRWSFRSAPARPGSSCATAAPLRMGGSSRNAHGTTPCASTSTRPAVSRRSRARCRSVPSLQVQLSADSLLAVAFLVVTPAGNLPVACVSTSFPQPSPIPPALASKHNIDGYPHHHASRSRPVRASAFA